MIPPRMLMLRIVMVVIAVAQMILIAGSIVVGIVELWTLVCAMSIWSSLTADTVVEWENVEASSRWRDGRDDERVFHVQVLAAAAAATSAATIDLKVLSGRSACY